MRINEIIKNIIATSSDEYIEEISNYLFDGNFNGKEIEDIRDLFATSHSNQSKRDDEDFKYFYDKVAYVDFCKFNNMAHNKLAAKKYLASSFNSQTREFSYSSNMFYKEGNTPLNTILVLNVKGKDIYKVLTAIYTSLRDNGVDNCITIPSFNRFEEGLTDSIRISINVSDMERVVGLIGDLPLSIVNLIDKPSMLYPRVNDYIGYDALISLNNYTEVRKSFLVSKLISDALYNTTIHFLSHNGNELIENGGETIVDYRKKTFTNNESLIAVDLRILQRMITVNPSNKSIFINNLKEILLGKTMTKSAYITQEDFAMLSEIYGKLDDNSILLNNEILEISIEPPTVEVEGEPTLNSTPMVAPANELLVQEEQSKELLVQEEQSKELLVQEDNSKDLLVQEDNSKELMVTETTKDSNINRKGSEEEYLDSLLASVAEKSQESNSVEETIVESASVAIEDPHHEKNVHFYEAAVNVGDNFVVSSNPAESYHPKDMSQGVTQENELVRPEDMTDEQKKLVIDTFAELPTEDTRFLEYFDSVINKLPEADISESSDINEKKLKEDTLNTQNNQNISSNTLDELTTYERALKYKDLVSSISILNTKVKGTDFTLLDYFDQQQLLTRIKPNAKYITFTDEVYTGIGIVEKCIIKYVSNYGNVPLDKIIEEYGIQELEQTVKQDISKGLKGLFKRKRS